MPKLRLHLTTRDYAVLASLGDHRFLSARQLAALHFPSEDGATRRLRHLLDLGLVHRLDVDIRSDEGTPSAVYALRRLGSRYVAQVRDGHRPPSLHPHEERTGLHLEHTLARNDLRLVLDRLKHTYPKLQLLSWAQERSQLARSAIVTIAKGRTQRRRFVPDGAAVMRVGDEVHAFAIEIDRSTVPLQQMALRFQAHWRYWRDGGARADHGNVPYRVLVLCRTERHLKKLLEAAKKAPSSTQGTKLIWFALQRDVDIKNPAKLMGPVWSVAHRNELTGQQLFAPQHLS